MPKLDKDFFKLSVEDQAKAIERETAKLLKRLPELKKKLKMYNEVSSELYNLSAEEIETIGSTYARAVRGGEISTPSSQKAYQKFVNDLRRYTKPSIAEIAQRTANERMESWLDNVRQNASMAEIEYAEELVSQMSDDEKLSFTRSKFFLDVGDWNSDQFRKYLDNHEYSIQTQKLEIFLNNKGHTTRNSYDGGQSGIYHPSKRR